MHIKITLFVGLVGVTVGYTSDRSPQRFTESEEPDYDHKSAAATLASHESFYDDSEENYHTSDDGSSEYDTDGSPGYSQEKSNSYDNNEPPKWNGPVALPPGYHANGQPHPVQDLPAVVAEKQKHFQLYAYGPHAGAAAAAPPYLRPVQGGYSSPWVPIIVPLQHLHHQHQHLQHQHQPLQNQQPFHYKSIHHG